MGRMPLWFTAVFVIIVVILLAGITIVMGAAGDVPSIIVLPKTGHRKPPITFSHQAHVEKYKTICIDCHHKGQNTKCSSCHLKRDQGNVINLKGAFHQQCHDCHRKTAGPRACSRCHINVHLKKQNNEKVEEQK